MDRRQFISLSGGTGVALAAAGQMGPSTGVVNKTWIDPKLAALPNKPWRKIHLDFHNSQHVAKIGDKFNRDEFGDRLLEGNVNAIVVFAKDMHGYFYYPSKYGPVHPGLDFDLLGEQVKACRERDIEVYAYYCVTWDHYLAERHPEWLVLKEDRTTYLPKFDQTPGWTALCVTNEDFVQLVLDHTKEFVSQYELDGPWFDMPWPINGECWCRNCLRQMKEQGANPFDRSDQHLHKHEIYKAFLKRLKETSEATRPGCQVDYNEQGGYGLAERVQLSGNMDIEALPTAQWGYYYFPTNTRYIRTHNITTYGMSGRFKASWADFGGLKLPVQLDMELAGIVAQAARCDIGDQPPPNGRLDPAVYHVIGKAYGRIKELEPYLEQAVPVTEAAIITSGLPFDMPSSPQNYGLVKLLMESRVQFDVVEPNQEWERYAMAVLPDDQPVSEEMARRLHEFISKGGAVFANHQSGLLSGTEKSWLEKYGLQYAGMSEFKPAYLVPKENFTGDIPKFEYALYEGASQWKAASPATVVAQLGVPAFQRSAEHYTSHRQTPLDHITEYAALARSGKVALSGFPIGLSYYNQGYWVYRDAFRHLVRSILPVQLVESNAPLSTEITVTHQAAAMGRRERYLVHMVNFSPNRVTPRHPDFCEDPIALTDLTVRLNLPLDDVAARAVVAGTELRVQRTSGGGVEVAVSRVPVSEIIVFEIG